MELGQLLCTSQPFFSPSGLGHSTDQIAQSCSLPYVQSFWILGSHVAHSSAFSHIFTDFCLKYVLGKLRCFIHIGHKKSECGKRASVVLYTTHQGLRILRLEHNVVNGCCFKIKRLCRVKKKTEKINFKMTSSLQISTPYSPVQTLAEQQVSSWCQQTPTAPNDNRAMRKLVLQDSPALLMC